MAHWISCMSVCRQVESRDAWIHSTLLHYDVINNKEGRWTVATQNKLSHFILHMGRQFILPGVRMGLCRRRGEPESFARLFVF